MTRALLALLLATTATPALAQAALPEPVRAMVSAAAETGDQAKIDAVVAIAKQTNPDSAAEIDAIVKQAADAREAKRTADLQQASAFDFWEGRLDIGGSVATGNNDAFNLAAGVSLKRDGLKWRHALTGSVDIQKANGITSQERILAGWQSNYKFSERLSAYGAFGYEKNVIAGIDNRFVESFGLSWRAVKSDKVTWDLEGGPAFRQTEFTDGTQQNSVGFGAGSKFAWQMRENLLFQNNTGFFFDSAMTIINETIFTTTLWKTLTANVSFTYQYEESPPPGFENSSTITRFTLGWGF
jgi:putative salt-induced outer membrane protein